MFAYATPVAARYSEAPRSGRTTTGYGTRIPVDCMVRLENEPEHRWHRVYAICQGNAASFYVRSRGRRLFVPTATLDALRRDWLVSRP